MNCIYISMDAQLAQWAAGIRCKGWVAPYTPERSALASLKQPCDASVDRFTVKASLLPRFAATCVKWNCSTSSCWPLTASRQEHLLSRHALSRPYQAEQRRWASCTCMRGWHNQSIDAFISSLPTIGGERSVSANTIIGHASCPAQQVCELQTGPFLATSGYHECAGGAETAMAQKCAESRLTCPGPWPFHCACCPHGCCRRGSSCPPTHGRCCQWRP